jgi:hypothetical protein
VLRLPHARLTSGAEIRDGVAPRGRRTGPTPSWPESRG